MFLIAARLSTGGCLLIANLKAGTLELGGKVRPGIPLAHWPTLFGPLIEPSLIKSFQVYSMLDELMRRDESDNKPAHCVRWDDLKALEQSWFH